MQIRLANNNDLTDILEIFEIAKVYMKASGNPTQWGPDYPSKTLLEDDIQKAQLYVILDDQASIHGAFVLAIGIDPTYNYIENGSWLNDKPYATIHRIASDGRVKGLGRLCFDYCKSIIDNLRCDTHHDNLPMQQVLLQNDFIECGIIYVDDGSKRLAYHYSS